jgi:hypothetical protein
MTFSFGTKAETLLNLQPLIKEALIPDIFFFTKEQWATSQADLTHTIHQKFGSSLLAIRSSALIEDSAKNSMAGVFLSKLNVKSNHPETLQLAIEQVVQSMTENPNDQILVQPMVDDIKVSGVIMTFDMVHGAPYYCIDYDDESGLTDTVTSGNCKHKSLFVYRHADNSLIKSTRVTAFLRLARELEVICNCTALDIEFGMNHQGQLFLFQVRRIALARNWHPVTERRVKRQLNHVENFIRHCSLRRDNILGKRTILAIMPDWNPAEIIGTTPSPLAASLYRELITKAVWCRARLAMGYRNLGDAELMVTINNHCYIDVRNSFNSFLPANIPDTIGDKLVNAWLDRLESYPEFHDKIEFEIVPTSIDFCFIENFKNRYHLVLDNAEFQIFHSALIDLTRACLAPCPQNTLDRALEATRQLSQLALPEADQNEGYARLAQANFLLSQCKELGSFSFAIAARHAFIAEAILRSAVKRGAFTDERLTELKRSIHTVTRTMVDEYAQVCNGSLTRADFLKRYGHLRPGTYEITSLRYDERDDLFFDAMPSTEATWPTEFKLTQEESSALSILLNETGLNIVNPKQLLAYAKKAIAAREYIKFVFTRSLSNALSDIVYWGECHGLARADLSYIEWPEIIRSLNFPIMDDVDRHYLKIAETAHRSLANAHAFRLGHIIFGTRDIYVATLNRSMPNFVGIGFASGKVVQLEPNSPASITIKNCIVCIENADPGFDWIFTKAPSALITRFGSANSHMAVRCAEFGLPAAIGCGDQIYTRIINAKRVELNCAEKIVRPIAAFSLSATIGSRNQIESAGSIGLHGAKKIVKPAYAE